MGGEALYTVRIMVAGVCATFPPDIPSRCIKLGCPPGGTVLDPFGDAILIDLNPDYAGIARQRIAGHSPLLVAGA